MDSSKLSNRGNNFFSSFLGVERDVFTAHEIRLARTVYNVARREIKQYPVNKRELQNGEVAKPTDDDDESKRSKNLPRRNLKGVFDLFPKIQDSRLEFLKTFNEWNSLNLENEQQIDKIISTLDQEFNGNREAKFLGSLLICVFLFFLFPMPILKFIALIGAFRIVYVNCIDVKGTVDITDLIVASNKIQSRERELFLALQICLQYAAHFRIALQNFSDFKDISSEFNYWESALIQLKLLEGDVWYKPILTQLIRRIFCTRLLQKKFGIEHTLTIVTFLILTCFIHGPNCYLSSCILKIVSLKPPEVYEHLLRLSIFDDVDTHAVTRENYTENVRHDLIRFREILTKKRDFFTQIHVILDTAMPDCNTYQAISSFQKLEEQQDYMTEVIPCRKETNAIFRHKFPNLIQVSKQDEFRSEVQSNETVYKGSPDFYPIRNNAIIILNISPETKGSEIRKAIESFDPLHTLEGQPFKILPDKNKKNNWCFEVNPEQIDLFLNKGKITISSQSCIVRKYYPVIRCKNCQRYGHENSNCDRDPVCCHCAGDHDVADCVKEERKCFNCTRYNELNRGINDVNHAANDWKCPVVKRLRSHLKNLQYFQYWLRMIENACQ